MTSGAMPIIYLANYRYLVQALSVAQHITYLYSSSVHTFVSMAVVSQRVPAKW
jgi:hypothetical protein